MKICGRNKADITKTKNTVTSFALYVRYEPCEYESRESSDHMTDAPSTCSLAQRDAWGLWLIKLVPGSLVAQFTLAATRQASVGSEVLILSKQFNNFVLTLFRMVSCCI